MKWQFAGFSPAGEYLVKEIKSPVVRAERPEKTMKWRSMESAPHGKEVLLQFKHLGVIRVGAKRVGNIDDPQPLELEWRMRCCGRFANPTAWMPLEELWELPEEHPGMQMDDDRLGEMKGTMINRESAEKFIRNQFSDLVPVKLNRPDKYPATETHYGRCELVQLLDAIYGRDGNRIEKLA